MSSALRVIAFGVAGGLGLFAATFFVWMRYSGTDTLISI